MELAGGRRTPSLRSTTSAPGAIPGYSRRTGFPDTIVRSCVVHLIRISLRPVPRKHRAAVAAELKNIYTARSRDLRGRGFGRSNVLAAAIKAVPVTIARAGLHGQAVEREWGRREWRG
ncbi:transposase [Actinomadura sp. 7K507]|uniref:transposase n=1 Tax=Actinomadura sp. 7K507 TaxID=2530365 RepID=UPI00104A75C6|nr:transposase [Actinomadura sp. 7K507]TDC91777.1 hypothetical protein E1285_12660 [Actinomadura sp. 7K507]